MSEDEETVEIMLYCWQCDRSSRGRVPKRAVTGMTLCGICERPAIGLPQVIGPVQGIEGALSNLEINHGVWMCRPVRGHPHTIDVTIRIWPDRDEDPRNLDTIVETAGDEIAGVLSHEHITHEIRDTSPADESDVRPDQGPAVDLTVRIDRSG